MRATMLLMLAMATAPAFAQDVGVQTPPPAAEQRPTTEILVAPGSGVTPGTAPSMLKPSPETAGDGTTPRQRLVTVFGTEPCPKPTSIDEVVVCARLPDTEIYRIPERLRMADRRVSPFQTNRNLLLGDVSGGAGGSIGSCSVNGPGGIIGCDRRQIDAWAQDRANRMGTDEETPR